MPTCPPRFLNSITAFSPCVTSRGKITRFELEVCSATYLSLSVLDFFSALSLSPSPFSISSLFREAAVPSYRGNRCDKPCQSDVSMCVVFNPPTLAPPHLSVQRVITVYPLASKYINIPRPLQQPPVETLARLLQGRARDDAANLASFFPLSPAAADGAAPNFLYTQ